MRLIDGSFLEDRCKRQMNDEWNKKAAPSSWADAYEQFLTDIENAPTVDMTEVRHGRWEEWWPGDCALIMTGEEMLWMCSECTAKFSGRSAYCPNCGAKMEV